MLHADLSQVSLKKMFSLEVEPKVVLTSRLRQWAWVAVYF